MNIYTQIKPTYLYIKKHSITGVKYFGKTISKDPYKYQGSGIHWQRHIKKHGKEHIVTLWVSDLYYDTSIIEHALQFSYENNITKSKDWANQKPENGLDGNPPTVTTHNKGKIACYNPITLKTLFVFSENKIPEGFIQGSVKSKQKLYYNPTTLNSKYFFKNMQPNGWLAGSPKSKSWRYKNIETNEIFTSKDNDLHITSNENLILYPSTKDKKYYYNPETLEVKLFYENEAPIGWINKNINQLGHTKTKNRKWYNNGLGKSKMFFPDNIPEGWFIGRY